jgi:hypothetical protein
MMTNVDYELIAQKAIQNAPDWLKDDIQEIIKKEGNHVRNSFVIVQLHNKYSFNLTHVFASMHNNMEWTMTSRHRLNIIDNNLDLVDLLIKDFKSKKTIS